ncbi:hypothetical protein DICVIV_12847 [Dictyocaulus viviparus]|uniref:Uncharacterized protein n=1 Tax=Dictyocaulus viviparus TaxID=29172 RepID=A0A0D8X9C7_DICVI|nr:hypothetical protein DICVIV_12847 [Dictyocaulus viviparus]
MNRHDGAHGPVHMGSNGLRIPTFYMDGLDGFGKQELYGTITVEGQNGIYEPSYTNETLIWWSRSGIRPLDEPLCGFTGRQIYIEALVGSGFHAWSVVI